MYLPLHRPPLSVLPSPPRILRFPLHRPPLSGLPSPPSYPTSPTTLSSSLRSSFSSLALCLPLHCPLYQFFLLLMRMLAAKNKWSYCSKVSAVSCDSLCLHSVSSETILTEILTAVICYWITITRPWERLPMCSNFISGTCMLNKTTVHISKGWVQIPVASADHYTLEWGRNFDLWHAVNWFRDAEMPCGALCNHAETFFFFARLYSVPTDKDIL
jgi:hypothetical protein